MTPSQPTHVSLVEGIEQWRHVGSSTFVPLACTAPNRQFRGRIASTSLGIAGLADLRADPHEVTRDRRMISLSNPELIKVGVQMSGTGRLAQNGRQAVLGPGDLALYETSRPYTLSMSADPATGEGTTATVVLMLPTDALGVPPSVVSQLTATRLPGKDGLGSLVAAFIAHLADTAPTLDPLVRAHLSHTARDLVETMIRQRLNLHPGEPDTVRRTQLLAIKTWIENHLSEPDLTPATIAAEHRVSVRYMYRLFESEEKPVASWIKERRLQRCRHDLADPQLARFGIGALAARWGMLDPAAFSRAFRAAYGESPRSYRARLLAAQPEAVPDK